MIGIYTFDVYSYGMIATSTLYRLNGSYPEPEGYAELADSWTMTGGEAANSSIILAKLGVQVRLDGNWLGTDNKGDKTLAILNDFQINTDKLQLIKGFRGVDEVVIADPSTRTILGTYVQLFSGQPQWNNPSREDIQNSRIINLDPFFKEESSAAARMCREMNKPYVTVDCQYTDEIAIHAAAVVIGGEYRNRNYKGRDKEELFIEYLRAANGLVVFTSGDADILYGRKGKEIQRRRAFQIQTVDTTGAGDSFRAGIVYGMLQGWNDEKTVDFAAMLAAYVCQSFPGVLNCPSYEDLVRFMEENGVKGF